MTNSKASLKALKRINTMLLAVLMCLPLFAQQTGISGRVTEASNAVIANVAVTATADDGTRVITTTNATGLYQFPGLRAGTYRLRFEEPGFAPAERTIEPAGGPNPDHRCRSLGCAEQYDGECRGGD
jgi:hypothetical protein